MVLFLVVQKKFGDKNPIVNEKRNLMTLVSVAQQLQVGSYECCKVSIHCIFDTLYIFRPKTMNYV